LASAKMKTKALIHGMAPQCGGHTLMFWRKPLPSSSGYEGVRWRYGNKFLRSFGTYLPNWTTPKQRSLSYVNESVCSGYGSCLFPKFVSAMRSNGKLRMVVPLQATAAEVHKIMDWLEWSCFPKPRG
jgi:hypothetical protein